MNRVNGQVSDFAFDYGRIKSRSSKDLATEFEFIFRNKRLSSSLFGILAKKIMQVGGTCEPI
jgi:hypothetical protein